MLDATTAGVVGLESYQGVAVRKVVVANRKAAVVESNQGSTSCKGILLVN